MSIGVRTIAKTVRILERNQTDYDPARGILDSLNNVMQTKFCEGYYFGESAEQKRGLFEALGVSVPGPETEKEQDYEDEEETEF